MAQLSNKEKMLRGMLYYAFTPELCAFRARTAAACRAFNNAGEVSRRRQVELWKEILVDKTPLPPQLDNEEEDAAQFKDDPIVEAPFIIEYGWNFTIGKGSYINYRCHISDICRITVGDRVLIGPNVSFFGAYHPLDPAVRNGTNGPELGKEIHVGDDVWIGGNVTLLPGVKIGRGAVVGAGSVVTKDVAPFTVVAGNPARFLKKVESAWNTEEEKQ
ncbi:hypothetical protein KEM54_003445 [Ascosphaera aggregata]|nr:hypothetical protein KEM54_003445 [Ascosphaera aggregata]